MRKNRERERERKREKEKEREEKDLKRGRIEIKCTQKARKS